MSNDPRASAPQPEIEAEDPLVELARIVSGGNQFEPASQHYHADASGDLEAELLAELHGGEPLDTAYGDDDFAALYPDLAASEAYPEMQPPTENFAEAAPAEIMAAPELDTAALEADLSAGFAQEFDAQFAAEPAAPIPPAAPPAAEVSPGAAAEMDFDAAFQAELDAQMAGAPAEAMPLPDAAPEPVAPPQYAAPVEPAFDPGYGQPATGLPPETAVQPATPPAHEPATSDLGAFPASYDSQYQPAAAPQIAESYQVDPSVVAPSAAVATASVAAEPEAEESGRNKYLLAAGFGGLLLVGALAVFAFNGSESTAVADANDAAIVSADADPIMVKPDDPGGVQIPNQDKAVYDRVNGNDGSQAPQQTALLEGAEDPVAIDRVSAPKADDRLTDTPVEATGGNSLLAPRRVQTVVVKPDGTIVQASPEVEQPTSAAEQQIAAVQPSTNTSATTPVAPAAPATPVIEGATPSTGIIPLPRSAPAGVQINQPTQVARVEFTPPAAAAPARPAAQTQPVVRPQAPAAQPAATENAPLQLATPSRPATAAPAAAAPVVQQSAPSPGGFVVQVSSQRSADAARASYANLQRRFSSILGGRSADIRQANVPDRGTFFRVRVPVGSRSDANTLCERLKAAGGSCFVSRS
ncbi:MAG: SPOR domain-containing protein [Pseudomonadota bacterium]